MTQQDDQISLENFRSIIIVRWIDELTRLVDLNKVLWRSLNYIKLHNKSARSGDDRLVEHIRDSLLELLDEVEDVKDRISD